MKGLNRNVRLLLGMLVFIALMIGLTYASVPLYSWFCRATGFGGTTQRVAEAPFLLQANAAKNRLFTVTFDGNVDRKLPWDFAPIVRSIKVAPGQVSTVIYRAHNHGDHTVTGSATDNVQPDKAGVWFDKIQCFCFTKQTLKPGQSKDLTVQFTLDPAILDDPASKDVQNITLSYTFFLAKN